MHVDGAEGRRRTMKEGARERGIVKDNGEKKRERETEGWVETAVKSLDGERGKQRGRWQRTAVATVVEAHEHHFY